MERARNDGKVDLIGKECMKGWSIGLKYFDDDRRIYVGEEVQQQFLDKTLERLDFVTLVYRKGTKSIEEVIEEIWSLVDELAPGEMTEKIMNKHYEHHDEMDKLRHQQRLDRIQKSLLDKEAEKG